jgi:hypothetical protein
VAITKHLEHLPSKNYVRIVAIAPDLRGAFFYSVTEFLRHSATFKLIPLLILIHGPYPNLTALILYWEVVISLMAAVARKFMQSRHANWYLQLKRSLIPASAVCSKRYIRNNLLTVIKAQPGTVTRVADARNIFRTTKIRRRPNNGHPSSHLV